MSLSKKAKETLVVAMASKPDATEITAAIDKATKDIANLSTRSLPINYYVDSVYGSIQAAYAQAVADGHNDSNPAVVLITRNTAENVTVTQGGIWFSSLAMSGTHSPFVVTGQWVFNGSNTSIIANHFALQGFEVVGPAGQPAIYFTGSNPQRLFVKDLWITANGIGGHCVEMDNTGPGSILEADDLKGSHNGTGYVLHIIHGTATLSDLETSGTISIAHVESGATLTVDSSECDANAPTAFDVEGGGTLVITRSIVNNTAANSTGINLVASGAILTLGEVLFQIPVGTGKCVTGVTGSLLFYAYLSFLPTYTDKISPAITSTAIDTAPTFA
jgi:hypothetical protein